MVETNRCARWFFARAQSEKNDRWGRVCSLGVSSGAPDSTCVCGGGRNNGYDY